MNTITLASLCSSPIIILLDPPVPHVDEVGDTVEGRHGDVRQREVDEEVVGDAPHAAVNCNKQVE